MSALHAVCAAFESPSMGCARRRDTFCSLTTLKSDDRSGFIQPAWRSRFPRAQRGARAHGSVAVRALRAVPGRVDIDEFRIDRRERLVVDPQPLRDPRTEAEHEDVGAGDQLVHDRAALWRLHVDRKALLALHHLGRSRVAAERVTHGVAVATLELDDARAERRREGHPERHRVEEAELHDRHARQRVPG
jgi:hypothetical protein